MLVTDPPNGGQDYFGFYASAPGADLGSSTVHAPATEPAVGVDYRAASTQQLGPEYANLPSAQAGPKTGKGYVNLPAVGGLLVAEAAPAPSPEDGANMPAYANVANLTQSAPAPAPAPTAAPGKKKAPYVNLASSADIAELQRTGINTGGAVEPIVPVEPPAASKPSMAPASLGRAV